MMRGGILESASRPCKVRTLYVPAWFAGGLGEDRRDMTREELLSRISIDPNVCFGKPCIRGRRIWVSLIPDLLAGGMKPEEIMEEYDLAKKDILACIAYGG
jgi:uncharacterized protein (DUF433 family)